jgi:hypothetical protein
MGERTGWKAEKQSTRRASPPSHHLALAPVMLDHLLLPPLPGLRHPHISFLSP